MANFKKGEGTYGSAAKMVAKLGSTPMSILRREAGKRDLVVRYMMTELRPATSAAPSTYVFAVGMKGMWSELDQVSNEGWNVCKLSGPVGDEWKAPPAVVVAATATVTDTDCYTCCTGDGQGGTGRGGAHLGRRRPDNAGRQV